MEPNQAPQKRKKKDTSNHYINNKDFTAEMIRCKELGELTPKAIQYFMLLVERTILKLKYNNPLDKEDCMQSALMDLCKYWRNFDPSKSTNAFSYFTQFVKNGVAKEYKKIHRHVGSDEKIEFVSLSLAGENEVFSI